ncbi:MAG TPA: hypothetical protein VI873_02060 [Candidatus Peribacteraceae bacterium]|nr:hypothetical protein [Candidatus Peribacteraceae bacterium]
MANRDVGVSICGVVVGVMLGAGSVLYAQDATLSANSSDVAYRGQDIEGAELYKARNVERLKLEDVRNDAGQNAHRLERKTGEDTTHESAPAVDVSTCGVATAIVARLGNVVTSTIPAQQAFEKFRKPIMSALSAVQSDYCGSGETVEAVEVQMDKPSAPKEVENDCYDSDKYAPGSKRQAGCLGNQNDNIQYIPN